MKLEITPKTISLVQPNKVTNAKYDFTAREENILTLMIGALQKFMTNQNEIDQDLFGNPLLTINMSEMGKDARKRDFLRSARNLMNKQFSFDWYHPEYKCKAETFGVLVTAVHNLQETNFIQLTLNTWAIPYLLYWGDGAGGTIFEKTTALTIKGAYAKRLYKLCKQWANKGGFSMSLERFREQFGITDKYKSIDGLRRRVLDPARRQLMDSADVYFTYRLEKIGGSRKYNQINFHIEGNNKQLKAEDKTDVYSLVYNVICLAYPNTESSAARDFTDQLAQDPEKLEKIYHRFKRIQGEFFSREKPLEKTIPLIKHILKNDYNLS
jgi:plasmid replication initiation protein